MSPFLFFLLLGVVLITIELLVLGLSAFWFLFIGFGALITALFAYFSGDTTWLSSSLVFVVSSLAISWGGYKPLKRWQDTAQQLPGNDAIGQRVSVVTWDEDAQKGKVTWSGTEWNAVASPESEKLLQTDSMKIAALSGIQLTVEKA